MGAKGGAGGRPRHDLPPLFSLLKSHAKGHPIMIIDMPSKPRPRRKPATPPLTDAEREVLARHYIFLRNVTFIAPSLERSTLPLWRGRLSEVSGWSLGRINIH